MKKFLLSLALASVVSAQAQIADDKNCFNHLSVGLGVGTTGVSIELGTPICPFVTMRAGVDIMPKFTITNHFDYDRPEALDKVPIYLLEHRYINIPEYGAKVEVKGKPYKTQGKLLFDIYTGKNSMFHVTVGATFGSSTIASVRATDKAIRAVEQYNADITPGPDGQSMIQPEDDPQYKDGIKIRVEGYSVTPNEGRVRIDAVTNAFRPYIGFGVGRTVPRKRVGCKFDMGVEFWGKPKVVDHYANNGKGHTITADEPGITKDFRDVIKVLNKIPVYPTLKFTVFGRIF
ncbi:MAG: hypothetical protein KBT12_05860 [Bacteroidales bacterium]|nr:hypothetical protein [Candidatus Physcousia equi]